MNYKHPFSLPLLGWSLTWETENFLLGDISLEECQLLGNNPVDQEGIQWLRLAKELMDRSQHTHTHTHTQTEVNRMLIVFTCWGQRIRFRY